MPSGGASSPATLLLLPTRPRSPAAVRRAGAPASCARSWRTSRATACSRSGGSRPRPGCAEASCSASRGDTSTSTGRAYGSSSSSSRPRAAARSVRRSPGAASARSLSTPTPSRRCAGIARPSSSSAISLGPLRRSGSRLRRRARAADPPPAVDGVVRQASEGRWHPIREPARAPPHRRDARVDALRRPCRSTSSRGASATIRRPCSGPTPTCCPTRRNGSPKPSLAALVDNPLTNAEAPELQPAL